MVPEKTENLSTSGVIRGQFEFEFGLQLSKEPAGDGPLIKDGVPETNPDERLEVRDGEYCGT